MTTNEFITLARAAGFGCDGDCEDDCEYCIQWNGGDEVGLPHDPVCDRIFRNRIVEPPVPGATRQEGRITWWAVALVVARPHERREHRRCSRTRLLAIYGEDE